MFHPAELSATTISPVTIERRSLPLGKTTSPVVHRISIAAPPEGGENLFTCDTGVPTDRPYRCSWGITAVFPVPSVQVNGVVEGQVSRRAPGGVAGGNDQQPKTTERSTSVAARERLDGSPMVTDHSTTCPGSVTEDGLRYSR